MSKRTKIIFATFVIFSLWVNFIIHAFHVNYRFEPLSGKIPRDDSVAFSLKVWLDGDFQKDKELKINNEFGLSNPYIRIYNQFCYSCLKKINARDVIIGLDGYLFEKGYIDAFYGKDFIGEAAIKENVRKLKVIQDSLFKLNKHLIVALCPGKASYYSEYIPYELREQNTELTNMRCYINECLSQKVNMLDLYDKFWDLKSKSKYILYPKYGIHWSEYGEYLVFEDLSKSLVDLGYKQNEFVMDSIEFDVKPRGRDKDIIDGMNVLFRPKGDTMAYPKLKVKKYTGNLPNAIVISDSFYWGFFMKNWETLLFTNNEFWYYYKEIHGNKTKEAYSINDIDLKKKIDDNDVFIIMATEATIGKIGWGAIDDLYDQLTSKNKSFKRTDKFKDRVKSWKEYIRQHKDWLNASERRANEKGISIDSSITLDAIYQTSLGN